MPDDEVTKDATEEVVTVDNSVLEAAIAERDNTIASHEATIASLNADLNAAKAANYDLLKSIPNQDALIVDTDETELDTTPKGIDSLFENKE